MDTTSTVAHSLPHQTTTFIGRHTEIVDIIALLTDPACRLLTLVGPGGIGKTRLAIEIVSRIADDFPDGVWFLALAPLTAPDQLTGAIAHVLQVPPETDSQSSPKQELLHFLRERHLLLVLDNFEHLLEGVELVNEILLAAPHLRLLVTSRVTLNMQAEWVQSIEGMRYPEPGMTGSLGDYGAIQLFAERARQVQPHFALEATSDCAIRICQLVEGVPLGIELATAWLRTVPCGTIIEQIQRGLDFLASDRRDVPERHRSMRAVFDHTWTLLTVEEQQVFERLSVFRGGCTLDAAEQVMGASLPVLASLVEKSLLTLDSGGHYQTHELLRQYAAERLEISDKAMIAPRDAHSAYYARFMHQREDDLKGNRQPEALDEIKSDFENVRAAWLWALERRDYESIDQMLETLDLFCQARSRFEDSRTLFAQAWDELAPVDDEPSHRVWGRVLARPNASQSHYEPKRLRERRERALAIARQYDDELEIATCLYWLGEVCNVLQDIPNAIAYLEESVALLRALGERFWQARALNELGICHIIMGQPTEAIPYSQAALDLRRQIGDRVGMGWCLEEMGNAYYDLGQLDQAERCWHDGLQQFRDAGSFYGETFILIHLMEMTFWNGEFEKFHSFDETLYSVFTEHKLPEAGSWNRILPGLAVGVDGDYEQCQTICQLMVEMDIRSDYLRFFAHLGLAIAACGLGKWEAASEHLKDILKGVPVVDYYDLFTWGLSTWKLFCPPIAALVLTEEGELEKAAELLGCAFASPSHRIGWLKRWSLIVDLADDLEAQLGEEAYANAWERGQKLDIDDANAALRARFMLDVDVQQQANESLGEPLTPRELEVLNLIYAGYANREIADQLVLAESTVKRHINHIYSKLAVSTRTHALARARDLGLLN